MLRVSRHLQVAIDCADPGALARFWASALGYEVDEPPSGYADWASFSRAVGDPDEAWSAVVDPGGIGPRVLFHRVPERKSGKNRVHLDVRAGGIRGTPKSRDLVDAEVLRLLGEGATHLRTVEDEHDYFAVMTDPEGNEFCLC
jgi:hypothetical protein